MPSIKTKTCPECNGAKYFDNRWDADSPDKVACPICGGAGIVSITLHTRSGGWFTKLLSGQYCYKCPKWAKQCDLDKKVCTSCGTGLVADAVRL